jgi:regulatory protein
MNKKTVYTVEEIKRKLERYCVYQDRCHKEVEEKMREYYLIPEARELILLHLMEHDFLNEERFSKSFARGKFRIKKWGRLRIKRELTLRNISNYNIKTALKEIDEEEYRIVAYSLAEKKEKLISVKSNFEKRRKIYEYLSYRGYEKELIYEVLGGLLE